MSLARRDTTSYSTDQTVWELDAPPTGSNTVSVTMSGANFNSVSTICYSFTGCNGVGNTSYNNTQSTPVTTSVTISANSMIIGAGISGSGTGLSIEIPQGTSRTVDWNNNINNVSFGGISPSLTSGSKTIEANGSASCVVMAVEVLEAAAASTRRVIMTV